MDVGCRVSGGIVIAGGVWRRQHGDHNDQNERTHYDDKANNYSAQDDYYGRHDHDCNRRPSESAERGARVYLERLASDLHRLSRSGRGRDGCRRRYRHGDQSPGAD